MPEILVRAHAHRGASLVEILQNCIIYFDGAFGPLGEKATAADSGIRLVHGEPMLFGKSKDKGLVFDEGACRFRVVKVGVDAPIEAIARHDETNLPRAIALAGLGGDDEPTALGVHLRPAARRGASGLCRAVAGPGADPRPACRAPRSDGGRVAEGAIRRPSRRRRLPRRGLSGKDSARRDAAPCRGAFVHGQAMN